mmetsp:Transcript_22472/g.67306  ORF Transcript_22472/g.67306 Transcript_22472/m.67306 type:complete len:263 (-) Transcript_22472:2572-3360(-)
MFSKSFLGGPPHELLVQDHSHRPFDLIRPRAGMLHTCAVHGLLQVPLSCPGEAADSLAFRKALVFRFPDTRTCLGEVLHGPLAPAFCQALAAIAATPTTWYSLTVALGPFGGVHAILEGFRFLAGIEPEIRPRALLAIDLRCALFLFEIGAQVPSCALGRAARFSCNAHWTDLAICHYVLRVRPQTFQASRRFLPPAFGRRLPVQARGQIGEQFCLLSTTDRVVGAHRTIHVQLRMAADLAIAVLPRRARLTFSAQIEAPEH